MSTHVFPTTLSPTVTHFMNFEALVPTTDRFPFAPSVKPPDPTSSNRTQSAQILEQQKDPREIEGLIQDSHSSYFSLVFSAIAKDRKRLKRRE